MARYGHMTDRIKPDNGTQADYGIKTGDEFRRQVAREMGVGVTSTSRRVCALEGCAGVPKKSVFRYCDRHKDKARRGV